eukprot:gene25978-biopygen12508
MTDQQIQFRSAVVKQALSKECGDCPVCDELPSRGVFATGMELASKLPMIPRLREGSAASIPARFRSRTLSAWHESSQTGHRYGEIDD